MAGGEQPRVEAEAVPERHNGVELSTVILSLWDLGLFSLLLRIHTRTSTDHYKLAAPHCCVQTLPSFLPSSFFKENDFRDVARWSLESVFLVVDRISTKTRSPFFLWFIVFVTFEIFFFFIYRWHVELNCVFQGKWWNSRRINYCRSKNRLWLLELFLM